MSHRLPGLCSLGLAVLAVVLVGLLPRGVAAGTPTPDRAPADTTAAAGAAWATQVSAGGSHTCAATVDGGVLCWGENGSGQLGDGTTQGRVVPVAVAGLGDSVRSVAAGWNHTCALTVAGAVYCWGWNAYGQLGDGTQGSNRLTPVPVAGLTSGVAAISAGYDFTCALTEEGDVKCWGDNSQGQLGDGTIQPRLTPVAVVGLPSGIQAIGASGHTCALTADGSIYCWGRNVKGQLGNGATSMRPNPRPVAVAGLPGPMRAISAGGDHTCAITAQGAALCWGFNNMGQLGDGTLESRLSPVAVIGLPGEVASLSTGEYHTCASLTDGSAWCWGDNGEGRLGDGTTTDRRTPVAVAGLAAGVRGISAGLSYTCAVTSGGVRCWGANWAGQLGDGTLTGRTTPVDVRYYDCAGNDEIPQAECQALLDLFTSTHLPPHLWHFFTGWLSAASPCQWFGVTCDQGHVTQLSLRRNDIYGPLPAELGKLSALQSLDLGQNVFNGSLPPEWGRLRALQTLNLAKNTIDGGLPAAWGELGALKSFDLADNRIEGPLPPELGLLSDLRSLNLSNNWLSGPLPSEWGDLELLRTLSLNSNALTGTLPAAWGDMAALQMLDLSSNGLSGALPAAWGNLAALQWLNLSGNALTGTVPPTWIDLTALTTLSLVGAGLDGPLPPELGDLSGLVFLDLGYNRFEGALPPEWGRLRHLQVLGLGHNKLTGSLPAAWTGLTALDFLELNDNLLSGPLPPEWRQLPVVVLNLARNQLSGPIPAAWGGLRGVEDLLLEENQLSGAIPPELGRLGSGLPWPAARAQRDLSAPDSVMHPPWDPEVTVNLGCNHLSGTIPAELLDINNLATLTLTANRLEDSPPAFSDPITPYVIKFYNLLNVPDGTQTLPPTDLRATGAGSTATLEWTPSLYTSHGGFYEISVATAPEGPYTTYGQTADKTASSYTITDLIPGVLYYFRLRTFTPAHVVGWGGCLFQPNDLWTDYTPPVSVNAPTTATPTATASPSQTPTATSTVTVSMTPTASVTPSPAPPRLFLPLVWATNEGR